MTYLTNIKQEVTVQDLTITHTTPTVTWNDTNNDIYLGSTVSNRLHFSNNVAGSDAVCAIFSNDGDRSDNVEFRIYGFGTNAASVNREFIRMRWNQAGDEYEISTEKNGTGLSKAIEISSNGNANQIYLDTGGSIGINKKPANGVVDIDCSTEDVAIVDGGSAAATQQDWIEVAVGGNQGYIHVYAGK